MSKTQPPGRPSDDAIHVLVMKDNLNSRALTVSAGWISRLGWTVGILTLVAAASSLFALRSYKLTRDLDPSHVRDLEGQIIALKSALESAKAAAAETKSTPKSSDGVAPPSSEAVIPAIDFSQVPPPSPDSLPFSLEGKSIRWRGSQLSVRFKIEYTKQDGGSQQGKIILLARGKQHIVAYPKGLFQTERAIHIDPQRGEYFSVSRIRFVNADFGPFLSRDEIDYVDVLVFDLNHELIYFERMKPTAPAPVRATPSPSPPPATESAETPEGEAVEATP